MGDFYITLPSSVSNPQHKNTSSRYVTRLPEVLNLERDKYVVAASDVIYPYSYVNVGKQLDYWIHFKSRLPLHVSIPPAQYSDASQIVNTLNGSQVRLKRSAALGVVENEIARVKRARLETLDDDEVGNLDADFASVETGAQNEVDQIASVFREEPIADEYSLLEGEEEETIGAEFDALAEKPAKSEKSDAAKSEKSEKPGKELLVEQQQVFDDLTPPEASTHQIPPPVEVPDIETRFDKRKLQEARVLEQVMDEEFRALDPTTTTSSHQIPPPVEVPDIETRFDKRKLQEARVLEQAIDEEFRALDPQPSSHQIPPPVEVPDIETRFDKRKLQEARVLEQAIDEEFRALDPQPSSHQIPPPVEVPEKETRFDGKKLQEGKARESFVDDDDDEYTGLGPLFDDDEIAQIDSEFVKLSRARIEHEEAARAYTTAQIAVANVVGDETIYSQAVEMLKKQRARITAESRSSSRDFLKFTSVADTIYCDFLDSDILFVELDEPCAYFLGFVDPIVRKSQKAEKKIDYFGNVSTLYLYCDVVDPIIVGNTKSALLSVIPCQGTYGEMIHHTVTHPRYLPLVKATIDSIRVDFLTEFGEPINFNWGSTIVVLHFKRSS